MGMYDTVLIQCPECGNLTDEQTKAMPDSLLRTWLLDEAPLMAQADIIDEARSGRLYCRHCNIQIDFAPIARINLKPIVAGPNPSNEYY